MSLSQELKFSEFNLFIMSYNNAVEKNFLKNEREKMIKNYFIKFYKFQNQGLLYKFPNFSTLFNLIFD